MQTETTLKKFLTAETPQDILDTFKKLTTEQYANEEIKVSVELTSDNFSDVENLSRLYNKTYLGSLPQAKHIKHPNIEQATKELIHHFESVLRNSTEDSLKEAEKKIDRLHVMVLPKSGKESPDTKNKFDKLNIFVQQVRSQNLKQKTTDTITGQHRKYDL